jgi:uncharacterized protein (TIGR03066 family)
MLVICLGLVLVGCGGGNKSKSNTGGTVKNTSTKDTGTQASNAEKIIGKWEVVKSEDTPPGAIIEFTKDGKMTMTATVKGKARTIEGTYKVKGDTIISGPKGGPEETATIETLNDTTLIIVDEKNKKDEFKRKN